MMQFSATPSVDTDSSPLLSSHQDWDTLVVEQVQAPPGEGHCHYQDAHTICLSLAPRPVRLLQIWAGKPYTGLYAKGDLSITPAELPFFARWEEADNHLQIRIAARFMQTVAREALETNCDRLELLPQFRTRDPQLEAIGLLLLAERQAGNPGSKLYIESLANVLAVHLIRQYATAKPQLPVYEGGLSQRQLRQVLDYIHDHLSQAINLADLAALLGMSQFHFSHQFKQSMGTTPYHYLLRQRIEQAKQLLKHSDRPITDIAFQCGFNSHSHLSKQFRQMTGMTPKAYRLT